MPTRTDEELMAAMMEAPLPAMCPHGRRKKSCEACENDDLTAQVEALESAQTEHLAKVQEWQSRMDELGRMVTDAEDQAEATVGALQKEVRDVTEDLRDSLEENRALQAQIQALTEETNA